MPHSAAELVVRPAYARGGRGLLSVLVCPSNEVGLLIVMARPIQRALQTAPCGLAMLSLLRTDQAPTKKGEGMTQRSTRALSASITFALFSLGFSLLTFAKHSNTAPSSNT